MRKRIFIPVIVITAGLGSSIGAGATRMYAQSASETIPIPLRPLDIVTVTSQWAFVHSNRAEAEKLLRMRIELVESCDPLPFDRECNEAAQLEAFEMMVALFESANEPSADWRAKTMAVCERTGETDCEHRIEHAIAQLRKERRPQQDEEK